MMKVLKGFIEAMNRNKNFNKGMTLVEVIVSIAILGILAVSFLPMFSTGIKLIVNNGNQIRGMYNNQELIEQNIANGTTSTDDYLSIKFGGKYIKIKGKSIKDGSLELFVTKK